MIRFFRNIRKSLLGKNKFSKYLLYAIGEILLVVIGILIALQIDNLNEFRKDREQEQELLVQLNAEYLSNLKQLESKIGMRNKMVSACHKLLDYVDHPQKRINDSILKYLGFTILTPTFDPIVNDIISSGRIQLLQNPRLKEKLSRWTSDVVQVTEEEIVWLNFRSNNYTPFLEENLSIRTLTHHNWINGRILSFQLDSAVNTQFELTRSKRTLNLSVLLDHPKFEDKMATCMELTMLTNSQSLSLQERITDILELIESELNRFNP
jgi:hypothetical protein